MALSKSHAEDHPAAAAASERLPLDAFMDPWLGEGSPTTLLWRAYQLHAAAAASCSTLCPPYCDSSVALCPYLQLRQPAARSRRQPANDNGSSRSISQCSIYGSAEQLKRHCSCLKRLILPSWLADAALANSCADDASSRLRPPDPAVLRASCAAHGNFCALYGAGITTAAAMWQHTDKHTGTASYRRERAADFAHKHTGRHHQEPASATAQLHLRALFGAHQNGAWHRACLLKP